MTIKRSQFLKGGLAIASLPAAQLLGCGGAKQAPGGTGGDGAGTGGGGAGTGGGGAGTGGGGASGSGGSLARMDAGADAPASGGSGGGGTGGSSGSGGTTTDVRPADVAADSGGGDAAVSCSEITSRFDQHPHTLTIPPEDVRLGVRKVYAAGGTHSHDVNVFPAEFAELARTGTTTVQSNSSLGHVHMITLTCK
jgi:hypothetical protein